MQIEVQTTEIIAETPTKSYTILDKNVISPNKNATKSKRIKKEPIFKNLSFEDLE